MSSLVNLDQTLASKEPMDTSDTSRLLELKSGLGAIHPWYHEDLTEPRVYSNQGI